MTTAFGWSSSTFIQRMNLISCLYSWDWPSYSAEWFSECYFWLRISKGLFDSASGSRCSLRFRQCHLLHRLLCRRRRLRSWNATVSYCSFLVSSFAERAFAGLFLLLEQTWLFEGPLCRPWTAKRTFASLATDCLRCCVHLFWRLSSFRPGYWCYCNCGRSFLPIVGHLLHQIVQCHFGTLKSYFWSSAGGKRQRDIYFPIAKTATAQRLADYCCHHYFVAWCPLENNIHWCYFEFGCPTYTSEAEQP